MKKTLILDSQQLSGAQTCAYYYNRAFNQSLIHIGELKPALSKGTFMHDLLYIYYKCRINGYSRDRAEKTAIRLFWWNRYKINDTPRNKKIARCPVFDPNDHVLLKSKFLTYTNWYQNDGWRPIKAEIGFSKVLYESRDYLFIYEGRIDLLVEFARDLMWVDHKTQGRKEDLVHERNQFLGYGFATGQTLGIINYLGWQTSLPINECFRRTPVSLSQSLIDEWKEMTIQWYFEILRWEANGIYLKNRHSCSGRYGNCSFIDLCKQTSKNRIETLIQRDFEVRKKWTAWE